MTRHNLTSGDSGDSTARHNEARRNKAGYNDLLSDLLRKGFSKKEAKHTIGIIQKAKEKKHPKLKLLDAALYWVLLAVAIIGNMIIAVILMPFLLAFKRLPLYFTIVILAAMFGALFHQLIMSIEELENKHILMAWIFIPSLATINIYYMASFANHLTKTMKLPFSPNSPLIISIVYVAAFTLPYILNSLIGISNRHWANPQS